MTELTEKQKAIQSALFKDKGINGKDNFTIDISRTYTTNEGLKAYYRTGSTCSVYSENALITAIYTGQYKCGLIHFISCKRKPKTV